MLVMVLVLVMVLMLVLVLVMVLVLVLVMVFSPMLIGVNSNDIVRLAKSVYLHNIAFDTSAMQL